MNCSGRQCAACSVQYAALINLRSSAMHEHSTGTRRVRKAARKAGRTGQPLTPEGEDAQRSARERKRLWDAIKDVPESRPPTKPL
jgi:hypothetical protein